MGILEEQDLSALPSIPEFYKGKTVFITGGSGFVGKVLIEKMLYNCSDLDRIYLLLRSKKGVEPEQRIAELYSSRCFDRLRKERPGIFQQKVFCIAGDVSQIGLGLSEEDRALIINRVNIIFHVAASVRFNDSLPVAVNLNLRGTKEVMELAEHVQNLLSIIHMSTSYANTNRDPIEEVVYPPHGDWRETLKICETLDKQVVDVFTPKFIGELPNTYVFTKQLAEHLVYEMKGKLPVVIMRPSIVISSHIDPMPGWIDNFNGPVGITIATGKGILRTLYAESSILPDYISVDICAKSTIAAAWLRGTKKLESSDDIPVYNCCSGKLNSITIAELLEFGMRMVHIMPLNDMVWSVGGSVTNSKFVHYTKVYLLHLLPALLIDPILWLLGKKPMLIKVQRRIHIANMALQYYLTQQWTFANTNFIKLRSSIKPEDHESFYYEIEKVDRFDYFLICSTGGRRYLLNEKDEDIPKARAHCKRIMLLDMVVKFSFYGFVTWKIINAEMFKNFLVKCLELIY